MKWNLNEVSLSFSLHKSLTYEGLFHKNKIIIDWLSSFECEFKLLLTCKTLHFVTSQNIPLWNFWHLFKHSVRKYMKNTIFSGIFNSDLFSAHEVLYPVQNMKSLVQLQEDLDSAISASLYKPSVSVVRFCRKGWIHPQYILCKFYWILWKIVCASLCRLSVNPKQKTLHSRRFC